MAKLHEVVGAVLRDIAQARVASDLYSREISRSYEQDAILRAFPAPRSEIMEVELDLRFSILGIEAAAPGCGSGLANSAVFSQLSEEIVRAVFARLAESSTGTDDLAEPETKLLAARLKSPQLRQKLAEEVYYHLDEQWARLAGTDQTLEGRQIAREVQRILQRLLLAAGWGPVDEPYAALVALAAAEAGPVVLRVLAAHVDDLAGHGHAEEASSAQTVEVEIAGTKLQELSPSAISTIKIKTGIRNYLWTHVGGDGATPIRKLIPE